MREGYTLPFRFRPHLTRSPTVISNYHNPTKQSFLLEALYQLINKNAVEPVENQNSLGFYNRLFGTQTQQPVETDPRPEHLEHLFKHRDIQDGNPRDNKNLTRSKGVGHIHRFQRSILPHTNSQSVQEVHALSPPGLVLPVQSPSLWPVHSSHGVHSGGQRGQNRGFSEGYKDPPVPRRLAGESLYPPHLSPAYSNPSHTLSGIRGAGEQGKVRAGSQTGLQLRRLPVRPERGQGQTNRRTLAGLDTQDQINIVGSALLGPTIHVPHRSTHSNRKASPLRATNMRRIQWHLKNNWRVPESLEKMIPVSKSLHPHLRWWLEESNVLLGQPLHPLKHALQIFTDASKEGWGAHLDEHTARGQSSLPESKLHINHLELKAVFLALKEFQTLVFNKTVLVATDNTTVVAYINKEGGMKSGSLCALLWKILSWCTRQQVALRARHIPGRLNVIADKLSRLDQTIHFIQKCSKLYVRGGISHKWTCLPPGSTTNYHSLYHRYQTPRLGQWMHSASPGRTWTHTPSHRQPSWAKWWRSSRTTPATE